MYTFLQEKCTKYWPDLGKSCEYGKITVLNLGEYDYQQELIMRMFDVSIPNYRHRRIFQYHYMVINNIKKKNV